MEHHSQRKLTLPLFFLSSTFFCSTPETKRPSFRVMTHEQLPQVGSPNALLLLCVPELDPRALFLYSFPMGITAFCILFVRILSGQRSPPNVEQVSFKPHVFFMF